MISVRRLNTISISFAVDVVAAEVTNLNRNCAYGVTMASCLKYDNTYCLYVVQLPSMVTDSSAPCHLSSLGNFASL